MSSTEDLQDGFNHAFLLVVALGSLTPAIVPKFADLVKLAGSEVMEEHGRWRKEYQKNITYSRQKLGVGLKGTALEKKALFRDNAGRIEALLPRWREMRLVSVEQSHGIDQCIQAVRDGTWETNKRRRGEDGIYAEMQPYIIRAMYNDGNIRVMTSAQIRAYHPMLKEHWSHQNLLLDMKKNGILVHVGGQWGLTQLGMSMAHQQLPAHDTEMSHPFG